MIDRYVAYIHWVWNTPLTGKDIMVAWCFIGIPLHITGSFTFAIGEAIWRSLVKWYGER